jgi:hypothetical protein
MACQLVAISGTSWGWIKLRCHIALLCWSWHVPHILTFWLSTSAALTHNGTCDDWYYNNNNNKTYSCVSPSYVKLRCNSIRYVHIQKQNLLQGSGFTFHCSVTVNNKSLWHIVCWLCNPLQDLFILRDYFSIVQSRFTQTGVGSQAISVGYSLFYNAVPTVHVYNAERNISLWLRKKNWWDVEGGVCFEHFVTKATIM